jgi:hypothetical protein
VRAGPRCSGNVPPMSRVVAGLVAGTGQDLAAAGRLLLLDGELLDGTQRRLICEVLASEASVRRLAWRGRALAIGEDILDEDVVATLASSPRFVSSLSLSLLARGPSLHALSFVSDGR